jgi:hypothetical protein
LTECARFSQADSSAARADRYAGRVKVSETAGDVIAELARCLPAAGQAVQLAEAANVGRLIMIGDVFGRIGSAGLSSLKGEKGAKKLAGRFRDW